MSIILNISELERWIPSQQLDIKPTPYTQWGSCNEFEYSVFILAAHKEKFWYFHKNAGEFSHSPRAIIELGKQFSKNCEINKNFNGFYPDLEIETWHDQICVSLSKRLLIAVPLEESINIILNGKTTWKNLTKSHASEIKVPNTLDSETLNNDFITVHKWMDRTQVTFSNQLVTILFNTPNGAVITKDLRT